MLGTLEPVSETILLLGRVPSRPSAAYARYTRGLTVTRERDRTPSLRVGRPVARLRGRGRFHTTFGHGLNPGPLMTKTIHREVGQRKRSNE